MQRNSRRSRGLVWVLGALWFTQVGVVEGREPRAASASPPAAASPEGGGGGPMVVPVAPGNPDGIDAVPQPRPSRGLEPSAGGSGGGGGGGGAAEPQDPAVVPVAPGNPTGIDAVPRTGEAGGGGFEPDAQDRDRQRRAEQDRIEFEENPQRSNTVDDAPSPGRERATADPD